MTLDLSSLFHTTIGFDHLGRILTEFASSGHTSNYPPYNIIKLTENNYRISIALAGFDVKDLHITIDDNILIIKSSGKSEPLGQNFLYKGIANRAFEKRFRLADNIKIEDANFTNGMLDIELTKIIPKKNKPRIIIIKTE